MNFLHTARAVILGVVVLLSVVVLALSSALIHTTTSEGFYFTFAALALAVSILTLLAIPPLIVSDHVRTGFVAWKVVVELIVIGVLSILWLGAAADTDSYNSFTVDCGRDSLSCREIQAIEAFSFLNWILLMGYYFVLLVWHSFVKRTGSYSSSSVPENNV